MGRAFDLDGKTIHRYCRKYGIELLSQPKATSFANSRDLPKRLFRPPLSPDQSWLLGIIALGTGCVNPGIRYIGGAEKPPLTTIGNNHTILQNFLDTRIMLQY